jgi:hypothetical protein
VCSPILLIVIPENQEFMVFTLPKFVDSVSPNTVASLLVSSPLLLVACLGWNKVRDEGVNPICLRSARQTQLTHSTFQPYQPRSVRLKWIIKDAWRSEGNGPARSSEEHSEDNQSSHAERQRLTQAGRPPHLCARSPSPYKLTSLTISISPSFTVPRQPPNVAAQSARAPIASLKVV